MEYHNSQCQRHRNGHRALHQLLGGTAGALLIPFAQILGGYHRAARAHGGKELDEHHIQGIHRGYGGHYAGYHGRVRHAYHDRQQLLGNQGKNQGNQGFIGKCPSLLGRQCMLAKHARCLPSYFYPVFLLYAHFTAGARYNS